MANILILSPGEEGLQNGNKTTLDRWTKILRGLGQNVLTARGYDSDNHEQIDVLVALHAYYSHDSIVSFAENTKRPIWLALTGTDLYSMLSEPKTIKSLSLATTLILLQERALDSLPKSFRGKANVIYQSARRQQPLPAKTRQITVASVGHLRDVKDPMCAAWAARELPVESQIQILQVGRILEKKYSNLVETETQLNPRYQYLGELPWSTTQNIISSAHFLAITSLVEGGANVASEAIVNGTPVIASRISGLEGILGSDYPGFYQPQDVAGLTKLLQRLETDREFVQLLKLKCKSLKDKFDPARENTAWMNLLRNLTFRGHPTDYGFRKNRNQSGVPEIQNLRLKP